MLKNAYIGEDVGQAYLECVGGRVTQFGWRRGGCTREGRKW